MNFVRILVAATIIAPTIVLAFARPAHAQHWQWTPYGPQFSTSAYGPARIPPGFRAPPVPDPYFYARAAQRGPAYGPPPWPLPEPPLPPPPVVLETPPAPPLGATCTVDPLDVGHAPLLNVRAAPNGWPIGVLPNGAQVVIIPELAGNWVRIIVPFEGWVFRPLLACGSPSEPPPATAYAAEPPSAPRAPRNPTGGPYPRAPEDGTQPYSPEVKP
jgi:hypothetical protein